MTTPTDPKDPQAASVPDERLREIDGYYSQFTPGSPITTEHWSMARELLRLRAQPAPDAALREAADDIARYRDGTAGAMTQGSFLLVPNGLIEGLCEALAAPSPATGGEQKAAEITRGGEGDLGTVVMTDDDLAAVKRDNERAQRLPAGRASTRMGEPPAPPAIGAAVDAKEVDK